MLFRILLLFTLVLTASLSAETTRETMGKIVLLPDSVEQARMIALLVDAQPEEVTPLIALWQEGKVYVFEDPSGVKTAILLDGPKDADGKQRVLNFVTGQPMQAADGQPLLVSADETNTTEPDPVARKAFNLLHLADPSEKERLRAATMVGEELNPERVPILQARLAKETSSKVKHALRQAIAMTQLSDENDAVKIAACQELGTLDSIGSRSRLQEVYKEATAANKPAVAAAASAALKEIDEHVSFVTGAGTLFRGLSSGSVLLIAAIGLAITFGLMGVINMAHGEMIAIGAYTTYVVQCIFGSGFEASPFGLHFIIPGMKATGSLYGWYFIVALPLSFLMAALAGLVLERSVIRFLYRRPLESLLATWGVSLVLQVLFKLTFGANNVQVSSPAWLSGQWTVNDIDFGWNRVFVIGFAVAIVIGTNLLLKKTPLGLLIRSVMQNRQMAACMGVRTERVNMMTFAFGSGLAGLAGAFLSQLGSVGPGLGQLYIVDSFMTVVVGGVGNIFGTVISSVGIGMADQSLQQLLGNPVLGKILVLFAIILFLQWKPAGLFVTRSRNLES